MGIGLWWLDRLDLPLEARNLRTVTKIALSTALLILLGAACTPEETPSGTTLLRRDLKPAIGADLVQRLGEGRSEDAVVSLPLGGKLKSFWTVATADDGGEYIVDLALEVSEAEGWKIEAGLQGTPINKGAGPGKDVRMAQALMVTQVKESLWGTSSGQTIVELNSDGRLETR